jgi:hypothetical protein
MRFTVKRIRPRKPRMKAVRFTRRARKAGNSTFAFGTRLKHGKSLPPGKYRLTAEATGAGGLRSQPLAATFRIVR